MSPSLATLAMVAGEASGDQLAAMLLAGLHPKISALGQNLHAYGIGGLAMQAQGFTAHWPIDKLAVRGYVEVLRHFPEIWWIRRQLTQQLLQAPPRLFLGVDAPDFNLALARRLKQQGIPTAQFVSPSIWAWRRERLHAIKASVDHMLVLFPFETEIYQHAGIPVTYVGHPFADHIPLVPDRGGARQRLGVSEKTPLLAVLPGSRQSELHDIAPLFIATMQRLHQHYPALEFVVPMAGEAQQRTWQALLTTRHAQHLPIHTRLRDSGTALSAADCTLVASGTATLEAALYKQPMVIAYKMAALSYRLMRHRGYLPYIGLPNILCGAFVVPELVQDAATPESLAEAVRFQWHDEKNRTQLQQRFTDLHHALRKNTAECASNALLPFLT